MRQRSNGKEDFLPQTDTRRGLHGASQRHPSPARPRAKSFKPEELANLPALATADSGGECGKSADGAADAVLRGDVMYVLASGATPQQEELQPRLTIEQKLSGGNDAVHAPPFTPLHPPSPPYHPPLPPPLPPRIPQTPRIPRPPPTFISSTPPCP